MSTEPSPEKIVSDDDWKERVRQENAALDQKVPSPAPLGAGDAAASPHSAPSEPARESPRAESAQYPAADFGLLVSMLSTQAMVALGALPHPVKGKPEVQLPLARHFIDLLSVLETKTARNLTGDEASFLESTLHYLRMSFLEQTRKPPETKP